MLSCCLILVLADCENDDSDPEDCCIKLKERTCQRGKNNKPCSEITLHKCSPSCQLYTRKTKTSTSNNYIISTIYLCLVSTAWTTRRMSISSTMSFSPSSSRQTSSVGAIEKLLTKSSNVLFIRPTPSMSISGKCLLLKIKSVFCSYCCYCCYCVVVIFFVFCRSCCLLLFVVVVAAVGQFSCFLSFD